MNYLSGKDASFLSTMSSIYLGTNEVARPQEYVGKQRGPCEVHWAQGSNRILSGSTWYPVEQHRKGNEVLLAG